MFLDKVRLCPSSTTHSPTVLTKSSQTIDLCSLEEFLLSSSHVLA